MSNTAPFLHIAYANDNTGTLDFTTTGGVERTYTGFYTDEYTTDSSDPTKYKWLTNAEFKNKVNNAAYAKSADGKDGFTTTYPNLNLLDGTKDFSGDWAQLSGWVNDGTYKGLTVKKRTGKGTGFYKIWTVPTDGTYTFSSYLKSSGNGGTIRRWVNRNWSDGQTTTIDMDSNFDWKVDTFSISLKAGDIAFVRYEITSDGTGLDIWNAGHKWEHGSTATPWMPSITEVKDSDYPQYIGLSNVTNPTTFKDYEWTFLESIPKKILNTHVAYANSSDGVTDFTTTYPNLNLLDGTSSDLKTVSANGWGTPDSLTANNVTFEIGKSYTYSAWIQDCDIDTRAVIYLFSSSSGFVANIGTTVPAGSSGFSVVTFGITNDITSYKTSIGFTENQASYHGLSYSRLKLEPGPTTTPWMPAASEVKDSDYPKFVGVYGDDSTTASQVPASYKWSSIPVPGPTPPVVDNVYILTMPTVKSINLTYGIGTLTTKPTSWLSTKPKLDVNQVLWYKSEITGTDNSVGVYYSNLVGGANLDDGDSPLDNTVVSIVLNNKTVNVPRDLALKLELLSQTLSKRDNDLAQLIADTNDRITNIDMGSGQAGLNQEVIDRKNADDVLGGRIDTVTGNVNDLTTTTQTKFTNIEKQLGGFSVQGTKNSSLTRPSIVFNYSAYGSTLPDGSTDGGGRLYYQVPGDTTYNIRELKFDYQTIPSFYDLDQITIWEKSWSNLYGGFPWRDTIITTTDTDTFYIDGMTTYYNHDGDLVIRGKVVMDAIDDWIGSMTNRGFKPDTVLITVASDLNSVKSIRFTGDMGVIEMSMSLGYSATAQVQRLGRRVTFYGSSPLGQFSTTATSWTNLSEKIPYGLRPTRGFEFAVNTFGNNSSLHYAFDTNGSIRIHQSTNNANQYQVMGQVGWQTFDQYPPRNYASNSAWTNR